MPKHDLPLDKINQIAGEIGSDNAQAREKALHDLSGEQAKLTSAAFRRELTRISSQVDMKQLGLSGFHLSGVHGKLDGHQAFEFKDKHGSYALLGADGKVETPAHKTDEKGNGGEKDNETASGPYAPFGNHGRQLVKESGDYTVKRGDNLWNIAKDLLRNDNSDGKVLNRDILRKVQEIESDNGRDQKSHLLPGNHLRLRVQKSSGEAELPVPAVPPEPSKVELPVPAVPPEPSKADLPLPAVPSETSTPELSTIDLSAAPPQEVLSEKSAAFTKAMADRNLSGTDQKQLQADLEKFLARDISTEEKTQTLDSLTQLTQAQVSTSGDVKYNVLAARELLFHAAAPDTVNQGSSEFCGPTSVEHDLLLKKPSKVAQMVTDALLTGGTSYLSQPMEAGGDELKPYQGTPPDRTERVDETQFAPDKAIDGSDNGLTFASHVFSSAMLNDMTQHVLPEPMQFKGNGYTSFAWQDGQGYLYSSFSNAVTFEAGRKQGIVDPGQGPTGWEISEEMERLTGRKDTMFQSSSYEYKSGPQTEYVTPPNHKEGSSDGMTYIKTPVDGSGLADFKAKLHDQLKGGSVLAQLKASYIDAQSMRAQEDQAVEQVPLLGSPLSGVPDHFISIDGLDGDNVKIHNQHGQQHDGWISIKALYNAMT
jgi:hypothetical protein